jgi:hypothetical protein
MLDHLRQKAAQTLASVHSLILSSCGPAEIQSSRISCAAQNLTLYVFIPQSSDHLLNLEQKPEIVAVTDAWDLHGTARVLPQDQIPAGILLHEGSAGPTNLNFALGYSLVEIRPSRLTFHTPTGLGNIETIDF